MATASKTPKSSRVAPDPAEDEDDGGQEPVAVEPVDHVDAARDPDPSAVADAAAVARAGAPAAVLGRPAVADARAQKVGIFAQGNPLRVHAFELRYLAGRRAPDRWVIDLGANDATILKPQNYHSIDKIEDRLYIPADFLCLFQQTGWQLQN